MFDNANILITGGTGSFGQQFVRHTLENFKPKKLIVFSRDEMKQWEMAKKFENYKCLRFFIGDVREKDRLYRALDNIDYVVSEKAAIKSQLDESKKRLEVGLIAITDYAEAKASYDLSETNVIEAENKSKRFLFLFVENINLNTRQG